MTTIRRARNHAAASAPTDRIGIVARNAHNRPGTGLCYVADLDGGGRATVSQRQNAGMTGQWISDGDALLLAAGNHPAGPRNSPPGGSRDPATRRSNVVSRHP